MSSEQLLINAVQNELDRRKLTRKWLALKCEVGGTSVSNFLNGVHSTTLYALDRYLKALGLEIIVKRRDEDEQEEK